MIKNYKLFLESKKTEEQALKMVDLDVLNKLKDIDTSNNQILLPIMAYFYDKGASLTDIEKVFVNIPNMLSKKLISSLDLKKDEVYLDDDSYSNWNMFKKRLRLIEGRYKQDEYEESKKQANDEIGDPVWKGNGITIYLGDTANKCVKLGEDERRLCISRKNGTMWQTYRDRKASTFYFIYDDSESDTDLGIVVFDNTDSGIEITDRKSKTGNLTGYDDANDYIDYLKSKGVPIHLLVNIPKSEQEIKDQRFLGERNTDLDWFIDLSPEDKSKYIGRGHDLTNDQFDYIFDYKMDKLINQYLNMWHKPNLYQFRKVETKMNYLKTYIKTCYQKIERSKVYNPTMKELEYMNKFGLLNKYDVYSDGKDTNYYRDILGLESLPEIID